MGASLMPLEIAADFNIAEQILTDLRFSIKKALFDEDLPPETGAVRSPTEIVARLQRLATNIGPAFGRLKTELVVKIVIRGLQILEGFEMIKFPVKIDGNTVKVKLTSPLAQQQSLQDIQNVVQAVDLSNVTAGPQATALGIKIEDLPQWFTKKLNVDTDLVRSNPDREKLMQMVAQMIAQQGAAGEAAVEAGAGGADQGGGDNVIQGAF